MRRPGGNILENDGYRSRSNSFPSTEIGDGRATFTSSKNPWALFLRRKARWERILFECLRVLDRNIGVWLFSNYFAISRKNGNTNSKGSWSAMLEGYRC